MRTGIISLARHEGSVLMVALMTALIMGTAMASYLTLVQHQNATVARSQGWNAALAAAEAGVEEALAQLTHVPLTTNINRGANGWVYDAGSYRIPSARPLLNGSYDVRFTDDTRPVIVSSGIISNTALDAVLVRTVEVRTINAPVFGIGMAAIFNIKMNGNNIKSDSFVSTNSAYSTNGKYDPAKARHNGDVASVYGIVDVGNGDIYGDLLTGPTGSSTVGSQGSVSGAIASDFNAVFEDVQPPVNLAAFLSPTSSMVNQSKYTPMGSNSATITYDYAFERTFSGGDYYVVNDDIKGPVYVGTNANVTLFIRGKVTINGNNNVIYIASGGKLTIYMAGSDFSVGGVVNYGTALDFAYYGLPSNTSISLGGNAAFTGTFYAPQAALSMDGGGSAQNVVDFCGACVVKSVQMNGHLSFHYDEALAVLGPSVYKAASWREL